jgi:hypothetical protein
MGYNKEQDVLIKAFKNAETINKKALYLFFIKENTTHSDIKGHMPFNRQFGFIYAANQSITELTRTMAHELGHGAFRLKHTFSNENEFVQDQGQTPNLMDYASDSELLKYQWDECHDFDLGCNWFEDGDEAESDNIDKMIKVSLFKSEIIANFYSIINRNVISKNEVVNYTGKGRGNHERYIIENSIGKFIYINPDDLSCYYVILPTNKNNPDLLKISKDVSTKILEEVYPMLLTSAGLATQKFADLLSKSATSKLSYELFKSKIRKASNVNPAVNSLRLAEFTKYVGITLQFAGKMIEGIGTVSLWTELLTNDMSPGEITDDNIQKSATKQFLLLFKKTNEKK